MQRYRFFSAFTLLVFVLTITAQADAYDKKVDCLVSDGTQTYLEGVCDYVETDRIGSFKLHSGTVEIELMADPDGLIGRAFCNDSSNKITPWVSDVQKRDACWGSGNLRICTWALGTKPPKVNSKPIHVSSATNNTQLGKCLLEVKGKKYIDGTCGYDLSKGGSFQIFANDYFSVLNMSGSNRAEGHWNAVPKASHAQAPLGTLHRKGACWVNAENKICLSNIEKSAAPTWCKSEKLSAMERLICSDGTLSTADTLMSKLYKKVMSYKGVPGHEGMWAGEVTSDQQDWLKERNTLSLNRSIVLDSYIRQMNALEGTLKSLQSR